jgi:succinate dehydrogenase/fumarate reductase flavoprotein subunit
MAKDNQAEGVTRRDFVKVAAVGAGSAGVAALGLSTQAKAAAPPAKWDRTADVVVAGAGVGGLCAAVRAVTKGCKVVLVEASKKTGGTGLFSSGLVGFAKGTDYKKMMETAPYTDPVLGKVLMDNFGNLKKFLAEVGAPVKELPAFNWQTYRLEGYFQLGGKPIPDGPRFFADGMEAMFKKAGGTLMMETKAIGLFQNQAGKIVGIKVMGKTGMMNIGAKAVILACGSFQNNKELLVRYIAPEADLTAARCVPYNDGTGLLMGVSAGAILSRSIGTFYGHMVPWPLIIPQDPESYEAGDATRFQELLGNVQQYAPQSIVVNLNGERFVDESLMDEWINQMTARQVKARAIVVLDQNIREKFAGKSAITRRDNLELLLENGAVVEKADTLEELAEKVKALGVHKANFLKTVREFNEAADQKTTADLRIPKNGLVFKIEKPPFYAVPATSGISIVYGGLAINPKAEVLGIGKVPIPGLYAIPGVAGGIMHTDMWCVMSGNMTFGYLAAENVAAVVKKQ